MQGYYSKAFVFFGQAFLNLFILSVAAYLVIILLSWVKARLGKEKFQIPTLPLSSVLLITTIACLGFSIGLLIGLSQSPVVQVAITGLLSFYGGFITFLFTKDSFKNEQDKIAVLISAIVVSLFLIYGIEVGSLEKNIAILQQKESDLIHLEKEEIIKKKYR